MKNVGIHKKYKVVPVSKRHGVEAKGSESVDACISKLDAKISDQLHVPVALSRMKVQYTYRVRDWAGYTVTKRRQILPLSSIELRSCSQSLVYWLS
jgi:hypothetical protein